MRLPTLLLAFVLLCTFSFAADERQNTPADQKSPVISQAPGADHSDINSQRQVSPRLDPRVQAQPQFFIPPRVLWQGQLTSLPGADLGEPVCYTMHTLIVSEIDKSGVTYPVGEQTCTQSSRFQTEQATADQKK